MQFSRIKQVLAIVGILVTVTSAVSGIPLTTTSTYTYANGTQVPIGETVQAHFTENQQQLKGQVKEAVKMSIPLLSYGLNGLQAYYNYKNYKLRKEAENAVKVFSTQQACEHCGACSNKKQSRDKSPDYFLAPKSREASPRKDRLFGARSPQI